MHMRRTRASGPVHGCRVIHVLLLLLKSILCVNCLSSDNTLRKLKVPFEKYFEDVTLEEDPPAEIGQP